MKRQKLMPLPINLTTLIPLLFLLLLPDFLSAQNPFIRDQFTADPTARVFNDRVYVYPSHDILANENRGRMGWFCMEDYHVFSSSNLTDWTDHGMIVSQEKVPWVDASSYSMWAPDCIYRNGSYYFYFPANRKDTTQGRAFCIGVAVSEHPEGPYTPREEAIEGVIGIDPNVLIDRDGQAYLYWSIGNIFGARLKENMLELDSEPVILEHMPGEGLKEGPFVFERNGLYYMTYPHVQNKTERLEYAIGDNPLGPFRFAGVIMDESPTGCWTNHHSIIEFQEQWYLFYHHNDLSPEFDKARSVRIDSLFFNDDGTIQKVTPTLRGVGLTKATGEIQLDRYSSRSEANTSIAFLYFFDTFQGWTAQLHGQGAWMQYNAVDFGEKAPSAVQVKTSSVNGGTLQIRLDNPDGPLLCEIKVFPGLNWRMVEVPVTEAEPGVHNLVVVSLDSSPVDIDWIQFKE